MSKPLMQVQNLSKKYTLNQQLKQVLDCISLDIYPGETIGIVGESGSGKSTLAKCLLGLCGNVEGQIFFEERPLDLSIHFRKKAQIIFQNPYSSLNPRLQVADIIGEGIDIHRLYRGKERELRIKLALKEVDLEEKMLYRYPSELSGGERQRVGIARALVIDPIFLVCDEPTSALDVLTQLQILTLLKKLQKEKNLTCLIISHNFAVIQFLADKVGVMYQGKLVEYNTAENILKNSQHPYTQSLIKSLQAFNF